MGVCKGMKVCVYMCVSDLMWHQAQRSGRFVHAVITTAGHCIASGRRKERRLICLLTPECEQNLSNSGNYFLFKGQKWQLLFWFKPTFTPNCQNKPLFTTNRCISPVHQTVISKIYNLLTGESHQV